MMCPSRLSFPPGRHSLPAPAPLAPQSARPRSPDTAAAGIATHDRADIGLRSRSPSRPAPRDGPSASTRERPSGLPIPGRRRALSRSSSISPTIITKRRRTPNSLRRPARNPSHMSLDGARLRASPCLSVQRLSPKRIGAAIEPGEGPGSRPRRTRAGRSRSIPAAWRSGTRSARSECAGQGSADRVVPRLAPAASAMVSNRADSSPGRAPRPPPPARARGFGSATSAMSSDRVANRPMSSAPRPGISSSAVAGSG